MTLTHRLASPENPARVVVIGGAGFVGDAVCRRLTQDGVEVVSFGRGDFDLQDSSSSSKIAHRLRPSDSVVFSAARAPCRDVGMMIDNMLIVRTVMAALAAAPVSQVVNISSDAVYGDEPEPITEAMPPAPTTLHGAMHLTREIALSGAVGDRLAILRPTLIYGHADPHNGYGPNRFRRLANEGADIVLFGEGEERRDHVLVNDVAELVARVLAYRSTGTLNVATGAIHSFRDAAEIAISAARASSTIHTSQRSGPMPHNGYRPFDPVATQSAFPDFRYVLLTEGMQRVQAEIERAREEAPHA